MLHCNGKLTKQGEKTNDEVALYGWKYKEEYNAHYKSSFFFRKQEIISQNGKMYLDKEIPKWRNFLLLNFLNCVVNSEEVNKKITEIFILEKRIKS